MLRKFAKISAPVDLVKGIFTDIEAWPQWVPGVNASKILNKGEDYVVVELGHSLMGMEFSQIMEFRLSNDTFRQRQVSGRFKKWEGEWKFAQPPDDSGTILSVALEIELGLLGMLVPKRLIQQTLDDLFNQMVQGVEEHAKWLITQQPGAIGEAPVVELPEERLLQVFQTAKGLELWLGERRYFIKAQP